MAVLQKESAYGFAGLPAARQLGLMIGLAASIALGGAVVMWAKTPAYSLLYGNLSGTDSSMVLESLQQANILYKVDESSGAVLVPSGDVHKARLKLASSGLPKGSGIGFELFDKEQELGTSQFIEQARYQYALEIELARSISTMQNVRNVRVHLAIPKRTVFARKKEKPTASVVLDLYSGVNMGDGQIAAIVHLVAAGIPNMGPEQVTVVDQHGTLLTNGMQSEHMALSSSQFDYTRRLENAYSTRIEDILMPIVGTGRVRAQVAANLDFTFTEKTQESYNPDLPALRSEQLIEERDNASGSGAAGVPGALSNQPAGEGAVGDVGTTQIGGAGSKDNRRTTRNYELDKTVSHTRTPTGIIRKLSVAVLVDDIQSVDEEGIVTRTPLSNEDITRYTALVKEAVGFDASRGDSINVINATFNTPPPPEPLPDPAIWDLPWVQNLLKQVLGGVVVLLIVFGVLRPVLRSLAEKGAVPPGQLMAGQGMAADQVTLGAGAGQSAAMLAAPGDVDGQIAAAKNMVSQDPARVAQVVKGWVETDG